MNNGIVVSNFDKGRGLVGLLNGASRTNRSASKIVLGRGLLWAAFLFLSNISFYFITLIALDLLFWNWKRAQRQDTMLIAIAVCFIFGLSILLSYASTSLPTDLLLLSAGVMITSIVALLGGSRSGLGALPPMRIALMLFASGNLLFYAFGLEGFEPGQRAPPNVTLQMFGLETGRAFFYFSRGMNAFGSVAGIMGAFFVADYIYSRKRLSLAGLSVCVVAVLLSDSRGALLSLSLVGGLAIFASPTRKATWLCLGLVPSAFILVQLDWLSQLTLEGLIRIGSDFSSGRMEYWQEIIASLNQNLIYWLFGAGIDGTNQIGLRVQDVDNFIIMFNELDRLPDAHNLLLDLIVTGGILKAAIYCFLLISTVDILTGHPDRSVAQFYLIPVFVLTTGVFESLLSYGRLEVMFVTFMIIGIARSGNKQDTRRSSLATR